MSNPKERHYWTQLRAALTAGQWRSTSPAKAPNGAPLSWSELFRKFNKHCKGYEDVAEVASQTHSLALLLATAYPDEDEDADVANVSLEDSGEVMVEGVRRGKLHILGESLLPESRKNEAVAGYQVLKSLQTSNFDTINFALAYYAYALGNPSECISHLEKVPQLLQFQNHIPTGGSTRSAATAMLAPSTYTHSTTSFTGSFTSIVEPVVPEVRDGRGWAMSETFRSFCLQGMSHEHLSPSDSYNALESYSAALPLFSSLQSEFSPKNLPKSSGKPDFTVFHQLRELWRWVERLLWRAVVLSSRTPDLQLEGEQEPLLWKWLGHYSICSTYWPPSFRTVHRSTVYSLHLRALVLRHGILSPSPLRLSQQSVRPPSTPSTTTTTPASASTTQLQLNGQSPASSSWLHSARSVVQEYRAVLTGCTKFPRAGQRNVKVEEFVDLCVAVWEASGAIGEQAGWVIDILWWATRLTFHSSRILRHMTKLLYLSGDNRLAKRTLKLYIQVVGKAYEASKEGVGEDKDTDEYWVDTLVFGARMLCKSATVLPGLDGIDDVKEAGTVLDKARTRLNKENSVLLGKVLLAEGIYWSLLGTKGQDPLERTIQLEKAHVLFQKSILAHSTPSAYYHLALSFARRAGPAYDLGRAIECAGHAVEGESDEVRYWHLLGILLTGEEKWAEAKEILEHGAELGIDGIEEEDVGDEEEASLDGLPTPDGAATVMQASVQTLAVPGTNGAVQATDYIGSASPRQANGFPNGSASGNGSPLKMKVKANSPLVNTATSSSPVESSRPVSVLDPDVTDLPLSESLLRSTDLCFEGYPPSKAEFFEWCLQLRMTQVALMEVVEGAEGAEVGWLEIFAWVAEQKGNVGDVPAQPQPQDGLRRSIDRMSQMPPPSNTTMEPSQHFGAHDLEKRIYSGLGADVMSSESLAVPIPIPITISPATPDAELIETMVVRSSTGSENEKQEKREREKIYTNSLHTKSKRSSSLERDSRGDTTKTKKVQQMFKERVDKGRAGITAVSRKIGHGVTKPGSLRRSTSSPDFNAVFQQTSYQASSIHSRRRLSSIIHSQDRTPNDSPPPPPPSIPPSSTQQDFKIKNERTAKDDRLLSDLWLMSAATFRRLGKIDQAKGSIQEAEVRDENNPNVWVQLGLYYISLGHHQHAVDTFQKALFIVPDDIAATVHLSRLYLDPEVTAKLHPASDSTLSSSTSSSTSSVNHVPSSNSDVDLAAGILSYLTKGRGWDVPEAWYFLAKAYGMQGRKKKEQETLKTALELSEKRGVRDIGLALGWCA